MTRTAPNWGPKRLLALATAFASSTLADSILKTSSFTTCGNDTAISVQKIDIQYNNDNKTVTFDVAGTSSKVQNVTAILDVSAYGTAIYSNTFNPCEAGTFVEQLCPVPAGSFSARGTQKIPDEYASMVPDIAFAVPDIAAQAKLQLKTLDTNEEVACITSQVTNGKTASVAAVSYIAAGVAGLALVATGVSAVSSAFAGGSAALSGSGTGGAGTISPSFTEVFGWFQGMAMNGMLSVSYPPVYSSFVKNFGFSCGIIPWTDMQVAIDNFRGATGGDLSKDSVEILKNSTLILADGSTVDGGSALFKTKRAVETFQALVLREIETSVNGTTSGDSDDPVTTIKQKVQGITAFVNTLSVPKSNTFMTVLLIVAIVIAAIIVGILLVKVILEFWALFGNFPKGLAGFREHYWGSIARAITSLIMLLYGIWVLYCIFQFTNGDSWAAKVLAGVSLGIFTGILAFFSYKIWSTARKLKQAEGDVSGLYDDKNNWMKYSLFYESYKKDYWWIFVPVIVYLFAKGCILAAGDGHGMAQTSAQLVVEGLMLCLLLWSRPFERKSGNVINITIQVVRVLSVACILVFVEEFGIAQTTQTVTGVVLIAVQSALTGVLALLIMWNAINACCKENPHRKRRKEMEKMQRDMDTLTPLDARNSLLMDRKDPEAGTTFSMSSVPEKKDQRSESPDHYMGAAGNAPYRPLAPSTPYGNAHHDQSRENLVLGAAPIADRAPTLPNVGGDFNHNPHGGYGGGGYRGVYH
ncbi:transient receptor potential ion channel [Colletotrichum scovillei]|uniref:Transient receptor potential ion channel n=1 Tax=Colletotrichum scovillei TaxID=1209932 RepID=A0A9P7UD15_9PEZI|nr:transient receptor potential ion channel [Colletotrichum scovillei]KAF4775536.1 transient receptor potential ion channel [Colletotrichum scovillei]KAG7043030.1 transient receptor potential ion channel [Colletotrichum scovillei]KAG7043617.1 transient receptor potential ion channel [Colletotrichum scovillei]KAG7063069.1 transient receptor potential ion channel [Colletotrichum scovillei]